MNPTAPPLVMPRARFWREMGWLCAGFFALLALFPVTTPFDSKLTLLTTNSLLNEGNIELDEYTPTFKKYGHGLFEKNGHAYNYFPLGPSLTAVPMMALVDAGVWLAQVHPTLEKATSRWRQNRVATGEVNIDYWDDPQRLFASVLMALAGGVMYALGLQTGLSRARALLLASVFVFCTPVLSTASRALWQHGPSLLCLALMLLCLVKARTAPQWAGLAGAPLALAYVMRPTNSVSVVLVSLYVLWTHPRQALKFFASAALVALPWMAVNRAHYGSILAPYFEPQRLEPSGLGFAEALLGNLVSPARGLFVFTPLLLLCFWGLLLEIRARTFTRLHGFLMVILVLHWLAISSFPHWWAGHCYGPRFFTDMVPYLVFFLVPVVRTLGWKAPGAPRPLTAAFTVLALLSLGIHVHGASSRSVYRWNSLPVDVDFHPERLWDWKDAQFLGRR
ncbi:hypothetical protein POL68_28240 [Stigmatella sp. ncwal1]|uniref:Dolichyl-phosphate-mannose-protein mannosyltransferase n=1 Tax=Stigmatella ashevillensis TaxID=2995309 RepID=A0ABT5DFV1_9BACT|nr:hypothetical protein [Stigmatella ashevillena]MDC0712386.1 hypothetical protein [Stigmatella ashevillena]